MRPCARLGDTIATGHPCTPVSTIDPAGAPLQTKVVIQGQVAAVIGSLVTPHTLLSGGSCIPHPSPVTVLTGSAKVSFGGILAARVGDSVDLGAITSGASKVIIG